MKNVSMYFAICTVIFQIYGFSLTSSQGTGPDLPSRRNTQKWKTGPSASSWYYIMGHPGASAARKRTLDTADITSISEDFSSDVAEDNYMYRLRILQKLIQCLKRRAVYDNPSVRSCYDEDRR